MKALKLRGFLKLPRIGTMKNFPFFDVFGDPPSGARHRNSVELQSLKHNYAELLVGTLQPKRRSTYPEKPILSRTRLTPG